MKIKRFKQFLEAISGVTDTMPIGPNYGNQKLYIPDMDPSKTNVLFSNITSTFYSGEDYDQLYNDYLKKNGKPIDGGFNLRNLETILMFLNKKN
jgi:hypothetical protein